MDHKQIEIPLSFQNFEELQITKTDISHHGPMAFFPIKYQGDSIYVKTDSIRITSYGIPHCKPFCPKDDKRSYINIGFDPYQTSCTELKNFLQSMDNLLANDKIKIKLFGKNKMDCYQYCPIVRSKDDMPDYCKIILNTKKNATKIIDDGKKISVSEISDIATRIKFQTSNKFIIGFQYVWVRKTIINKKCLYGVSLSMIQIERNPNKYPITIAYDKESLRKAYKKYMDEKKKSIPRYLQIEV